MQLLNSDTQKQTFSHGRCLVGSQEESYSFCCPIMGIACDCSCCSYHNDNKKVLQTMASSYCHPMTAAAEPRGRERRMWVINYGEIPLNLCNTVLKLTTIHLFMLTFGGGFPISFSF